MSSLFDGLFNLGSWLDHWCRAILSMPHGLSAGTMCLIVVIVLVWCFSGLIAANIAESRGIAPQHHFIAGLFLPYLYPLFLFLSLKLASKTTESSVPAVETTVLLPETENVEEPTGWTMARMEQLRRKADGTESGPFLCRLLDGRELHFQRIVDVQARLAVFAMDSGAGKTATVRFPYEKIASLEEIEETNTNKLS